MNKLLSDKINEIIEQLKNQECTVTSHVSKYQCLLNACLPHLNQLLFEEKSIRHINVEEYVIENVIELIMKDFDSNWGFIKILELFHDRTNTHHVGITVKSYEQVKCLYPQYNTMEPTEITNEIMEFLNNNTKKHLNWLNNFNFGTAQIQEDTQRCFLNISYDINDPTTWKQAAQQMKIMIDNNSKLNSISKELDGFTTCKDPSLLAHLNKNEEEKIKKITHKRITRK
jgi:hypothetical protein